MPALSPNKKVVESYFSSQGTEYAALLADDVELVEWASGVPATGAVTKGRAAFVQDRGSREYQREISRMTEEGNVVVAEGFARGFKKDGGRWTVHFCDIFELEQGKVKRLSSLGFDVQEAVP